MGWNSCSRSLPTAGGTEGHGPTSTVATVELVWGSGWPCTCLHRFLRSATTLLILLTVAPS